MVNRLRTGTIALALLLSVSPGRAVTCEESRSLSPSELNYWAERLQVSPKYLAALLEKAFCVSGTRRERGTVQDQTVGRSGR